VEGVNDSNRMLKKPVSKAEGVKPPERTPVREDGFTSENAADGTFSASCYRKPTFASRPTEVEMRNAE